MTEAVATRLAVVRRGLRLNHLVMGYDTIEAVVSLVADPVAALLMVPIIAKEGMEGLRGDSCWDENCWRGQGAGCYPPPARWLKGSQ